MAHSYYGIIAKGRRFTEVKVTRRDGRQVSQVETGKTYKTFAEGCADNLRKNGELWERMKCAASS